MSCYGVNFRFFSSVFKILGVIGGSLNACASVSHHSVVILDVPTSGAPSTKMLCLSAGFGHALHFP